MEINKIYCGSAFEVLKSFPDESISCCVTSPPYWNLRDYQMKNQLGLEKNFQEYLDKLCTIFDEVKRVLRKDGNCFVNIGTTFNSGVGRQDKSKYGGKSGIHCLRGGVSSLPTKCDCMIPERFALAMVERGWIKRRTIIWYKPNCMPSSVSDDFTLDFEYIYRFVKSNDTQYWTNKKTLQCVNKKPPGIHGIEGQDWEWIDCPNCKGTTKYNIKDRPEIYSEDTGDRSRVQDGLDHRLNRNAGDEPCKRCKETGKIKYNFWSGHDYWFEQQFEPLREGSLERCKKDLELRKKRGGLLQRKDSTVQQMKAESHINSGKYLESIIEKMENNGRNMRSVWKIATKGYSGAHFATFPEELPLRCIKAGCPKEICSKCGLPRVKIIKNKFVGSSLKRGSIEVGKGEESRGGVYNLPDRFVDKEFVDYTNCNCGEEFHPGIVMDIFCGAGTTCLVAKKLNRSYIGIELNPEYVKMAEERIKKELGELF